MKIILRRYLTNSSPLVNGFPCMEYTISEKDYEKTRDEIGTKYNHECLTRGDTSTISCPKYICASQYNCQKCEIIKTRILKGVEKK